MKQDIRELFREENISNKGLPVNHREEFLEKLKVVEQKERSNGLSVVYKYAAMVFIALTIGTSIFYTKLGDVSVSPMVAQIEAIEAEYIENIEKEWESFLSIAEDKVLIDRFKNKLDDLDAEYQGISIQFKKDSNNILVIESLVENLQTRLQILKDIQNHIKILNQKNEPDEKAI